MRLWKYKEVSKFLNDSMAQKLVMKSVLFH